MLNAFRHQRESHPSLAKSRENVRVLNAFRHQRESHPLIYKICLPVLNAFRHQRESHSSSHWPGPFVLAGCSTPFGIKENRTTKRVVALSPSAQRLSASKRIALEKRPRRRLAFRCSTPFGIKENRTKKLIAHLSTLQVLNAFRHQRESHATRKAAACSCAQRLSASKRIAHRIAACHGEFPRRAQRLSASKRIARRLALPIPAYRRKSVLNAFRHQRESHPKSRSPASRATSAQRLSASKRIALRCDCGVCDHCFCAQRLSASKRIAPFAQARSWALRLCSTPFGIKENRTVPV